MGDNQNGFICDQTGKGCLYQSFILHIQGSSSFIQKNDRRIFQKCTGNRDTLALSAGKFTAIFPDIGMPSIRQFFRKFIHIGKFRSSNDLFICGVFVSDSDIFQNRIVKQCNILEYDGIQRKQCFRVNSGYIHASHGNLSSVNIPEPCCQPGYGCFSAARWADQSRNLSLFCRKGNIFQYGFSGIIGKPDMVKDNIIPLIGKPITALLDGMIENFIHTGNVGSCTDDCRKILECALQRVI